MIALIPARAGSERLPGKNTRCLHGQPVIAYTIAAAQQSGIFDRILVCSDDDDALTIALEMGVGLYRRPPVDRLQPDVVWVREVLALLPVRPLSFAILRPTSPFRTADTIRRCYAVFEDMGECGDAVRAVEPVRQTPYKMWTCEGDGMPITPLLAGALPDGTPYHSAPTQACPVVYIQNSSLEMSWTSNVEQYGTLTGRKVAPFFTRGVEGLSLDTAADWQRAVAQPASLLPSLPVARVSDAPETLTPADSGGALLRRSRL